MAIKRKFDVEADDVAPQNSKQLKLVPFPNYEPDMDVAMDIEPISIPTIHHHARLPSDASSSYSSASSSPVIHSSPYPTFDLYPHPFFGPDGSVDTNSHNFSHYASDSPKMIGLMQPSANFAHHGTGCTQIPKLRIACSAGLNGQRTMWSHCEQCGAISMVDAD
jgi:hypothetical protein